MNTAKSMIVDPPAPAGIEWPTLLLIAACYGGWIGAGALLWPQWPLVALSILALLVALHSSLMHEAAHGHPTRSALANEVLVGLPLGLVWPYRRFRRLHLRHHADERLTDPFDDPESCYKALWQYREMPRAMQFLLGVNNTMVGRFLLGPALTTVGLLVSDGRLIAQGDASVRRAWLHHAIGLVFVVPVVLFVFDMPLLVYLVPAYLGQSLLSIRTFAEHQWSERPDGRTIIVERSPLAWLFLNNNLHFVHHRLPNVAWYRLPGLFRERREEWLKGNGGYAYPGYFALLREFALRPKEPVAHPALRRVPDPGTVVRPRVRARSVHGGGTAPVPAQPSKD